nr:lipoyl(octanoyl) transferase LipB [candidate division Zixibacteria bacterium]
MNGNGYRRLLRFDLGRTKYEETWKLQKKLVTLRSQKKIPDCLIITEHDPVITMGRGTDPDNLLVTPEKLLNGGISLFEVERGGDITFHGPGQTVLYPIIDLHNRGCDVHQYLRDLEQFVINTLEEIGLEAETRPGPTGIWVDDYKIGAIGVAVSRWITYHGLALNVNTNLKYFDLINPCGITEYPVGSIADLLGEEIDMKEMNNLLAEMFAEYFNYQIEENNNLNALPGSV